MLYTALLFCSVRERLSHQYSYAVHCCCSCCWNWTLVKLLPHPGILPNPCLLLNLAHLKARCRGVCRGPQQALGVRQAGLPQSLPLPLLCWASIHLCFIPYKYNIMIVVGTEIWSGGRARASKRVAMQACTVDRFPVPYRYRIVF